MNWQGIPFKLLNEQPESLTLAVKALPDLVLKSDPDYRSAVITGLVSLIAGLIPAGIALFTFLKNAKIIRQERMAQQLFLKAEREEQQNFLKEERSSQFASMEADRQTQKEIAEKNFNMQVLSANRQAWINRVRELIAEYMSIAPDFLTAQFDFINSKTNYEVQCKKKTVIFNGVIDKTGMDAYLEARDRLSQSISKLNETRQKEKLLTSTIQLMLNPQEKWYIQLTTIFREVTIIYNSLNVLEQSVYIEKINALSNEVDKCLTCSQELLKYEWERVKKGE